MVRDPQENAVEIDLLKEKAKLHALSIALEILGPCNTKLTSQREARWGNRGSFALNLCADLKGQWFDHEVGQGGDIIELVKTRLGLTFPQACEWLWNFIGEARNTLEAHADVSNRQDQPAKVCDLEVSPNDARAKSIWDAAESPNQTIVEAYLRSRKCWHDWLRDGAAIRYHASCPSGRGSAPAMVGLISDAKSGCPMGVHRTFLEPDGSGKSPDGKKILGSKKGGVIRLKTSIDGVTVIAEGIENALTAAHLLPHSVISAIDAGNMGSIPFQPGSKNVTIFSDSDPAGQKAAFRYAARCRLNGIQCRILKPKILGKDLNDLAIAA